MFAVGAVNQMGVMCDMARRLCQVRGCRKAVLYLICSFKMGDGVAKSDTCVNNAFRPFTRGREVLAVCQTDTATPIKPVTPEVWQGPPSALADPASDQILIWLPSSTTRFAGSR